MIREKKLEKLGMHASDTALLAFQDVRVPALAVLGQVGNGFYHIMWELQGERLIGTAGSVAAAQHVFDRTLQYAQERTAFGRPIGHFQVIRHKFAEMATKIETAGRWSTRRPGASKTASTRCGDHNGEAVLGTDRGRGGR